MKKTISSTLHTVMKAFTEHRFPCLSNLLTSLYTKILESRYYYLFVRRRFIYLYLFVIIS